MPSSAMRVATLLSIMAQTSAHLSHLSGHSGVVRANDNCCGRYGCPLGLYVDAGGRNIETFWLDVDALCTAS